MERRRQENIFLRKQWMPSPILPCPHYLHYQETSGFLLQGRTENGPHSSFSASSTYFFSDSGPHQTDPLPCAMRLLSPSLQHPNPSPHLLSCATCAVTLWTARQEGAERGGERREAASALRLKACFQQICDPASGLPH